ncbi:MAG TPA: LysR family transcriptional regulator [Gammaproteobacteria bacterium]|nr:LysR family transcriptional regulator [Gammaproteobacteria bacterium]
MDTETLTLFLDVMRVRNFSRVADARGMAPSSISRAITALEQELGVRLFQRTTRRLEPTEAGRLYFERVAPLVAEFQSAAQMARDLVEEPRGTLRLTASTVHGQMYVVPLVTELAAQYPALSIDVLLTDAWVDLVEERVDIAVRLGSLQDSSCIARRVADMRFHVCASPAWVAAHDRVEAPQQLAQHDCLLFPRPGYDLNWLFRDAHGRVSEVPIHGRYLMTNSQAIKQCALAGMGIALLPDWLVDAELADGQLLRLLPEYEATATDFDSAVWLVYPSRDYLPLKTRLALDLLGKRLGERPATFVAGR